MSLDLVPAPVGSRKPVLIGAAREAKTALPPEDVLRSSGNTGNLAFAVAIAKVLLDGQAPSLSLHHKESALDPAHSLVLPCANFLSETDSEGLASKARLIDAMGGPVVALGLGAQAPISSEGFVLHPHSRQFMDVLAQRRLNERPNISVRGEFTRRVLEAAGYGDRIEVLGCPSLFLNPTPGLGRAIQQRFDRGTERIAVGGWAKNVPSRFESLLAALCTESKGLYIVQQPKDLVFFRGAALGFDAAALAAARAQDPDPWPGRRQRDELDRPAREGLFQPELLDGCAENLRLFHRRPHPRHDAGIASGHPCAVPRARLSDP